MSKSLIIVFHYYVLESPDGQKPAFKILQVLDEEGAFLQNTLHKDCLSFGGKIVNNYMEFSSKEHMQDFFITWAEENKLNQMKFLALSELNYLLQNCHNVHDFSQNYGQYSQVWNQQSKKDDSLFKGLFKQ